MTTPGEYAKQIRELTGLNQRAFAKQMGIANSVLSMLENGKQPMSARYAELIAATATEFIKSRSARLCSISGRISEWSTLDPVIAKMHEAGARARGWRV